MRYSVSAILLLALFWATPVGAVNVPPFTSVEVKGAVELVINHGTSHDVDISRGRRVLTKVDGGRLSIECPAGERARIQITTSDLVELRTTGAIDVLLSSVRGKRLDIRASGTLTLRGQGRVDALSIRVDGVASVALAQLQAKRIRLESLGSLRGQLNADELIAVRSVGLVSLERRGEARFQTVVTGFAEIGAP